MSTALVHARVLVDDGLHDDLAVLVDGARIRAVLPADAPEVRAARQHDLGGHYLLPGFIDCQVNGGGGVLLNATPTVEGIRSIAAAHRRFGTAGLLPTLISDRPEVMRAAIEAVDAAMAAGVPGVLGIHLEGPFLAPARKGIHDAGVFRVPDAADLELIAAPRRGVTVLTVAPECVAPALIARLAARGVIVCAGHTDADYATVRAALAAGLRGFTHLFNAMRPLANREPGVVGAALADPDSWCGLIVDGHHVHPATLRVAIAAKARGKMILVTDAMPPVGADDPAFVLNGETITVRDGVCQNDSGTLAGSALDMASAVRNAVHMLGLPLKDACRMASTWPAEFLRLDHELGRITPGHRASFTVLDADLAVRETWIDGLCQTNIARP